MEPPVDGNNYLVLEGAWRRNGLVLLQFPSHTAFRELWFGDEYRAMKEPREAHTVADNISFAGVAE